MQQEATEKKHEFNRHITRLQNQLSFEDQRVANTQSRVQTEETKLGRIRSSISALEVERKLLALEEVQEVAVVGIADEEWGQRVAAVVKQREGVSFSSPFLSCCDEWY